MKKFLFLHVILLIGLKSFPQVTIGLRTNFISNGKVSIVLNDISLKNDGDLTDNGGIYKFIGIENTSISGTGSNNFNVFEMSKTGGTKLILNNSININSFLNFTSGLLDLNGNNVLLNSNASLYGESETSRIIGPAGGYVEITQVLNSPSAVNPGNLGATITTSANMGTVTIRRGHEVMSGTNLSSSISRYYNIIPQNNVALRATLRLNYFDAELNGQNKNMLAIWQSNPLVDANNWHGLSYSYRDATNNFVEQEGMSEFYLQTLAVDNSVIARTTFKQTAISESSSSLINKLIVGPNPNNGNFYFSIEGIEKTTIVELLTIDGKAIGRFAVTNMQKQQVNGLRSGVYFLRVHDNGLMQKIIVQ